MVTPKKNTRQKILETAGRLFAESGFTATSMDDISQEVGVRKSTLYHYFESKKALLVEILDAVASHIIADLEKIVDQHQDPKQALRAVILRLVKFGDTCPEMHIFSTIAVSDMDRREVSQYVMEMKRNLFVKLKELILTIDPCNDRDEKSATLISFTILGMVVNSNVNKDSTEVKKLVDHLLKIIDTCALKNSLRYPKKS